jgi:hypothetical protein
LNPPATGGFAPTLGFAGTTGLGFGAGGGPLLPIMLFGLELPGVEDGDPLVFDPFSLDTPFETGGTGAGGALRATGGGGGAECSMSLRLVNR